MSVKTKAIPDGYRRVTPALVVQGGEKDSVIIVEDESLDRGTKAPPAQGMDGSPSTLFVYVENVDDVVARAVKLGAALKRPPEDQFYGDRDGYIVDPFGHGWTVASHVEDVEPDELMRRMEELQTQA